MMRVMWVLYELPRTPLHWNPTDRNRRGSTRRLSRYEYKRGDSGENRDKTAALQQDYSIGQQSILNTPIALALKQ